MDNLEFTTVKRLSSDLKVSKQTIYNKIEEIKQETPVNEHSNYFERIGNTLNVKQEAVKMIYYKLGVIYKELPGDNTTENTLLTETIKTLQEQLKVKDEQLKTKDEQILKLTETIQQQQESITTQLKADREQGYIKALETQVKALEAQTEYQGHEYKQQDNVFKRAWAAIKGN